VPELKLPSRGSRGAKREAFRRVRREAGLEEAVRRVLELVEARRQGAGEGV